MASKILPILRVSIPNPIHRIRDRVIMRRHYTPILMTGNVFDGIKAEW